MYSSKFNKKSGASPARLLLLVASFLLLTACQSTPYLPEVTESEIEQPQPGPEEQEPDPESEPHAGPLKPTITVVEPATASPGDVVMVIGDGFGKDAGKLRTADGTTIPT